MQCFAAFRGEIPAGMEVPCPPSSSSAGGEEVAGCSLTGLCEGVGHATCEGGSLPINAFGNALREKQQSDKNIKAVVENLLDEKIVLIYNHGLLLIYNTYSMYLYFEFHHQQ